MGQHDLPCGCRVGVPGYPDRRCERHQARMDALDEALLILDAYDWDSVADHMRTWDGEAPSPVECAVDDVYQQIRALLAPRATPPQNKEEPSVETHPASGAQGDHSPSSPAGGSSTTRVGPRSYHDQGMDATGFLPRDGEGEDPPIRCGTFGGVKIPPDIRKRMDEDRAKVEATPPQEPPAYQFSNEPRRPFPRPPSEGLDIAAGGVRHFTPPQERKPRPSWDVEMDGNDAPPAHPKPQPGRCPHGKSDPVKCRHCAFPGDGEGGGDGSDR